MKDCNNIMANVVHIQCMYVYMYRSTCKDLAKSHREIRASTLLVRNKLFDKMWS